jgi:hypothetical protein
MQTPAQREYARKWQAANRDKVKGYPGKRAEANRRFVEAHPGVVKECQQRWNEANPDKITTYQLKAKFGITLEAYTQMLVAQGGVCAICGKEPGKRRLDVDHDHETGKIRGLLCNQCNQMLGYASDSITTLQNGIEYLSKRRTSQ